jgi:hypothetical protein
MSVTGMTSDGSIVVGNTRNVNQTRPAIWDAIHGPRYLDDILLDQFGQAMSGWSQFRAQGISGDGRSIIGRGVNPDGNTEAWIAYLGPAPTIPGDFNNDGAVDAADYVAWRDGRGTRYTQGDYEAWRAHFGQTAVLSAAAGLPRSENPAVPEPYTFAIAAAQSNALTGRKNPQAVAVRA